MAQKRTRGPAAQPRMEVRHPWESSGRTRTVSFPPDFGFVLRLPIGTTPAAGYAEVETMSQVLGIPSSPPVFAAHSEFFRAPAGDHGLATYDKLRELASRHLGRTRFRAISTTTLVHESYLRLARSADLRFLDRDHFLRTAAQAMRWIVVEKIREANQIKRGGKCSRIDFRESSAEVGHHLPEQEYFVVLRDALDRLLERDPRGARVIALRSMGIGWSQIALACGVSRQTVLRDWKSAVRSFQRELEK